jgi:hypothetical protein
MTRNQDAERPRRTSVPRSLPLSLGQHQNAEPNLARDHGIDDNLAFVAPQPLDDPGSRSRSCGLAQNVGVDQDRLQRVGRLGFDWEEEVLFRAREEPVDHAFIRASRTPDQPIFAAVEAFDLEFLARFNTVLLSELGGQHDLALR